MPIMKMIEPEREQIPFYDALNEDEIQALVESDSFSYNVQTGVLDIHIPDDIIIYDPIVTTVLR